MVELGLHYSHDLVCHTVEPIPHRSVTIATKNYTDVKVLHQDIILPRYYHIFFGYKTEVFSFQNNSKDLDPSYKTDLDLWDRLGRVKLVLQQNFYRTNLVI